MDDFFLQHSIISIPETLKELVKHAQTLSESFETLGFSPTASSLQGRISSLIHKATSYSSTLSESERLCKEILELLFKLGKFYHDELACIEEAGQLEPLVLDLKREMHKLRKSNTLFTKTHSPLESRSSSAKIIFNLFSNRTEVEAALSHLKTRVGECDAQFTDFYRRATSTSLQALKDNPFERIHPTSNTSALRLSLLSLEERGHSDDPKSFPDSTTTNDPLISKALKLLDDLQLRPSPLTLREGAWKVVTLAFLLYQLELYGDAAEVSEWGVNILESMINDASSLYVPYFVMALQNLGRYASVTEDVSEISDKMPKCVESGRDVMQASDLDEYLHLFGRSLTVSSIIAHRCEYKAVASSRAVEAVEIFERLFKDDNKPEAEPVSAVTVALSLSDSLSMRPLGFTPATTIPPATIQPRYMYDYAAALHQLASCHETAEEWDKSLEVAKRGVEVLNKLTQTHPTQCLELVAETHYQFNNDEIKKRLSDQELHAHFAKAVACYRPSFERNKTRVFDLYNAIWELARVTHPEEAATDIWNIMYELAIDKLHEPAYLADAHRQMAWSLANEERYEESISFRLKSIKYYHQHLPEYSTHEADGLIDLASAYHNLKRFDMAVATQQQAIFLHTLLIDRGAATSTSVLADCHAQLAEYYVSIKDLKSAQEHSMYSINMYDGWADLDPERIPNYAYSLQVAIKVAFEDDEPSSCEESATYLQELINLYEKDKDKIRCALSNGYSSHGFKLNKHGRTEEAIKWAEDSLPWFETQPLTEFIAEITNTYLATLINLGDDLNNYGYPTKALQYIDKAIEVGNKYCANERISAPFIACAMFNRPDLLMKFGRNQEALAATIEAVEYARSHPADDVTQLAASLATHALALSLNGRYHEAVTAAEEGKNVTQAANIAEIAEDNMFAPLQVSQSLRSFADALLDVGQVVRAVEYAEDAYQAMLDIKQGKKYNLAWSFAEVEHSLVCLVLATCYLAHGQVQRALDIYEEQCDVLTEKVKTKAGRNGTYALLLRLAGWCWCALGRHEEGLERGARLQKILLTVTEEMRVVILKELEQEAVRPSYITIWKMLGLQCGHHHLDHLGANLGNRETEVPSIVFNQ